MNHRKSLDEIRLTGDHVNRALKRPPAKVAAKKKELLALFADLEERRAELLTDVRKNGLFIFEERWSGGKNIAVRVPNPAVKMLTTIERQMVSCAKALNAFGETPGVSPAKSALDAELESLRAEMEMN